MSIFVTIAQVPAPTNESTYARPAFSRGLRISRMSHTDLVSPSPDQEMTYEAIYFQSASSTSPIIAVAMFQHRYGDQLHTLVSKALAALGEAEPKQT